MSQGTYGAVVMITGFVVTRHSMTWMAKRLASHGFVVSGIERSRIVRNHLGIAGGSMGSGGALGAALQWPSLRSNLAMVPWDDKPPSSVDMWVPTQVMTGEPG